MLFCYSWAVRPERQSKIVSRQNTTMRLFIQLPILAFLPVWMIAGAAQSQTGETKIPQTLAEAHTALERLFTAQELAEIDRMKSEAEMVKYHFSLGMSIRNSWGLWRGSPLAKHLQELGFIHPDDMSGVVLETFWCKRHQQPFRLKEKAQVCRVYWEALQKSDKEEAKRVKQAQGKLKNMMMGLKYEANVLPRVRMPNRTNNDLRARFLAKFRDGVFLTAKQSAGKGDEDYVTQGYYFDPTNREIHKITPKEIEQTGSAVALGEWAWFAGVKAGHNTLVGINGNRRLTPPLPEPGQLPQLGGSGEFLLAVYPHSVYRLNGGKWSLIYSGERALPRSGSPPQMIGDLLFFRDEGRGENQKRLWWLTVGPKAELTSLDRDVGLVGPEGPRWENSFSYCVTEKGDLWATVGEGYAPASLLRRSKEGTYSIAVLNNGVLFNSELLGSGSTDQGLSVSCVTSLPDASLLLVGNQGLYHLKDNTLVRTLAFENTRQKISVNGGVNVYHWGWDPSNALVLDEKSYFISGAFGGIYVLEQGSTGQFTFRSLDERLGEPIIW